MTSDDRAEDLARSMAWHRSRLLMIVSSLTAFGIVMIYSASAIRAARGGGWEMSYAWNQLSWLVVAVSALAILSYVPHRFWLRLRYPILLACYGLLALVLTSLGTRVNGATRWFRFGGMNVQPSELAKIAMLVFVAAFLARIPDGRPRLFRHVIPLCGMCGATVGLIAVEPDFGTAALIGTAVSVLMIAGGVRIWQFLLLVAPAVPAAAWYGYSNFEYIGKRIHSWADGNSYHTNMSEMSIGSGGVMGVSLGQGTAKLDFLPEAHTDFIFGIVGQETGLIGGLSLIALFIILIWQGLIIARNASDRFGSLLAFGITIIIGGQAAFNMGVVTGLLPPKGISLPFVSFGGSGLVVFYSMIGLMVSITRSAPVPVRADDLTLKYRPRPALVMPGFGREEAGT